jgi:hypothetical protein
MGRLYVPNRTVCIFFADNLKSKKPINHSGLGRRDDLLAGPSIKVFLQLILSFAMSF